MMSERALRSMLNSIAKEIRQSKGKTMLKLLAEQKRLDGELKRMTELKRQIIQEQLAQIQAAKQEQN